MNTKLVLFAVACLTSLNAFSQASNARSIFESGANIYVREGAQAAVKAWLKGSALEGNTQAVSQANSLRQVEDFYGKPESHEVMSESQVGTRTRMLLAAIYFQKGPLYTRMQIFQLPSGDWVLTEFKFHTEAAQLFPNSALYGR